MIFAISLLFPPLFSLDYLGGALFGGHTVFMGQENFPCLLVHSWTDTPTNSIWKLNWKWPFQRSQQYKSCPPQSPPVGWQYFTPAPACPKTPLVTTPLPPPPTHVQHNEWHPVPITMNKTLWASPRALDGLTKRQKKSPDSINPGEYPPLNWWMIVNWIDSKRIAVL